MRTFVYQTLIVLCLSARIAAAESADLAPLIADDVSSVVYVNLEKVDLPSIAEELINLAIVPQSQVAEVRQQTAAMQSMVAQLTKAGARRAYLLVRASDFFHGPTLVVEAADEGQAKAVADLLKPWMKDVAGDVAAYLPKELVADGPFVVGASSTQRLEEVRAKRSAGVRDGAMEAISSIAETDVGLVAFGDQDSRRVVREMFPQFPAPFGEIDGKLLADGLKSISVTLKLPPSPTVSLSLTSRDQDAGDVMEQSFAKGRELLKAFLAVEMVKGPEAHKKRAAALMPMLPRLQLERDENILTLTFGDDDEELAMLRSLLPAVTQQARDQASRAQRMNNFKQIMLAMLNYESAKGTLPPAASYDDSGRPLLSWRVHILPYTEEMALYNQFKLDEPWDSEHNRKLIDKMPALFIDPAVESAIGEKGRTTYVVPIGEGLVFGGKDEIKFRDIKDGTSNTIVLVEVPPSKAVIWTKPDDWPVDLQDPMSGLVREDREWFTAGYADGHVSIHSTKNEPGVIRSLLTPNGGEVVEHASIK
jgi:Protein of unknown function (DUF1559)